MGVNEARQELSNILIGDHQEVSIYIGTELIWPVLDNIAFSNGFWVDEFPWDDNSYWVDLL